MKLIKINTDHYVVVDNSEIKEGDWYVGLHNKVVKATDGKHYAAEALRLNGKSVCKITHSTQPLSEECKICTGYCEKCVDGTKPFSLQEVKELLGEVDVEKKAFGLYGGGQDNKTMDAFIDGYNQALEDNKKKKHTEEDLYHIFNLLTYDDLAEDEKIEFCIKYIKDLLQPKTEWEVEIVDGKLKLKQ